MGFVVLERVVSSVIVFVYAESSTVAGYAVFHCGVSGGGECDTHFCSLTCLGVLLYHATCDIMV